MFEDILRFAPREFKKRHVMSVDISTSAISAILAVRHENTGIADILKTLKNPLNLMGENFSGLRTAHVIREGILKIFRDARAVTGHLDEITVILSDPFFSDITFSKEMRRHHPEIKISSQEISALFKTMEKEAESPREASVPGAPAAPDLVRAGEEMFFPKVNGYEVLDPAGYKGKSMEISAVFTFINQFMKETVIGAHDKFFPRAHLEYVSDTRLIRKTLLKLNALQDPAILFNVDGEATGVYLLSNNEISHLGISTFGTKTLERRVSSLPQYAQNMLEENLKAKTESLLKPAFLDWWEEISQHVKKLEETGFPKKCFIAGRDPAVNIFPGLLANYLKSLLGFESDLKLFSVEPMRDLIRPSSFVPQNQDILLASLLN